MMNILDFYHAVSAGDVEKVREYHSEHSELPVNKNFYYLGMMGLRPIKLPLIIAFYDGHLETAKYLWHNGADLDIVCQKCLKTPREFMPEGFTEGNCRILSFKVFKDRVYEAAFSSGFANEKTLLKRLQKGEERIREMYEYATNEDLFCALGTAPIKTQWSEGKLRDRLHASGKLAFEDKLKFFRNGDYLWPYILTTARLFS